MIAVHIAWYTGAFFVTYTGCFISSMWSYTNGEYNDILNYIAYGIVTPLQGLWDFLLFARNRHKMNTCEGRFLYSTICCCKFPCTTICSSSPNRAEKQNESRPNSQHHSVGEGATIIRKSDEMGFSSSSLLKSPRHSAIFSGIERPRMLSSSIPLIRT